MLLNKYISPTPWFYLKRFIIRNWSTQLGKLTSSKIHRESATWRPRSAWGGVPVWEWRPEPQESQWCSYNLEAGQLETQDKPVFPFKSEGRRKLMSQFEGSQAGDSLLLEWGSGLLFYSGLRLIQWGPPTSWRAICFTQSTNLNVNFVIKTVPNLQWFNLHYFDFTLVQKQYAFSKNHTSNFEFGSFPRLVICSLILSHDVGQ